MYEQISHPGTKMQTRVFRISEDNNTSAFFRSHRNMINSVSDFAHVRNNDFKNFFKKTI